ncbi:MAG: hypothetical protein HUJ91_05270, partial [Bacteroidales bacterium]|nr:hypothetical protein [Bacteroidales bacterium]
MAKLLSADIFELYVFGLGVMPMGLSFVLARVVIAFELFLGIWMLSGVKAVWSSAVALLSLAAFSGFLIWRMWLGDNSNCHCFGELIDFTPQQSLLKNMALTAALLPTLWRKSWLNLRHGALYVVLTAVVSLAVVLIVSPPDNFRYGSYSSSAFNEEEYRKSVDAGELPSMV